MNCDLTGKRSLNTPNTSMMLLDSASYSVVPAVFLKIRVVSLQVMEVYGEVGIQLCSFFKLGARRTEG